MMPRPRRTRSRRCDSAREADRDCRPADEAEPEPARGAGQAHHRAGGQSLPPAPGSWPERVAGGGRGAGGMMKGMADLESRKVGPTHKDDLYSKCQARQFCGFLFAEEQVCHALVFA